MLTPLSWIWAAVTARRIANGAPVDPGVPVVCVGNLTLGGTGKEKGKRHPTIGDGVLLGAGAKVIGPITVGAGSKVGANALVVHDIPPNSVVTGVVANTQSDPVA